MNEKKFYRFICVKCRVSVCQLSEPYRDAMKKQEAWWFYVLAFLLGQPVLPDYICDKCLNAIIMDV